MYFCLSKINVSIYFITYLHGQSVVVIAFHPWVLFFEYQHCHFGRLVNQLKLQFIHWSFTPHIKIYIMIVTINKNIDLHCKFWNYIENYLFFTFTCRLKSRDTVRWKLTYNKSNKNMHWNMDRKPLEHF